MRNWAGQDITPGAIVWRGARDGNTSSFKVGRVIAVDGGTAKVHWVAQPDWRGEVRPIDSTGRPSVNSLALIDPSTLHPKIKGALQ